MTRPYGRCVVCGTEGPLLDPTRGEGVCANAVACMNRPEQNPAPGAASDRYAHVTDSNNPQGET